VDLHIDFTFQPEKIILLPLRFWHSHLLPVKCMWTSAYQMMQW